jgi:2-iminobutanoate/2-iminopropanoate deaminase
VKGKAAIRNAVAPPATPLFSQGVQASGFIFTTKVGLSPSGKIVSDRIEEQARQSLENIRAVLASAGARLSDVVQMTIYLIDFADASAMNEVYASFFPDEPPSRACLQVAALAPGVKVEMQAVACVGSRR